MHLSDVEVTEVHKNKIKETVKEILNDNLITRISVGLEQDYHGDTFMLEIQYTKKVTE